MGWFTPEQIAAMRDCPEGVARKLTGGDHPAVVGLIKRMGQALSAAPPGARLAIETVRWRGDVRVVPVDIVKQSIREARAAGRRNR